MKLLYDFIAIQFKEEKYMSKGGIALPQSTNYLNSVATVCEVGEGFTATDGRVIPLHVKKGDKVVVPKLPYQTITVDGEEYMLLKENQILCILEKGER